MAIEKRGNSWRIRYDHNGVHCSITKKEYARYSKREMERIERQEIERDIARREEEERRAKMITLGKAAKMYFQNEESNNPTKSTVIAKNQRYKNHIAPFFGEDVLPVDTFTTLRVQEYKNMMCQESNLSTSVVNHTFSLLRQFLDYLGLNDLLDYNSIGKFKTMLAPISSRGEKKTHPDNFLTKDEYTRFIDAIDDEMWRIYFQVSYWGGLRIGEILGLKFSNIDYDNRTITIDHQLTVQNEETKTKTFNSDGTIGMRSDVLDELRNYQLRNGFTKDDYVFNTSRTSVRRVMSKYLKKAGIEKSVTPHGMRHSLGSLMASANIDLATIAGQMRHSDPSVTMRTYVHQFKGLSSEELEKL